MDYKSPIRSLPTSLPPHVWGPSFWNVFHTFSDWYITQRDVVTDIDNAAAWIYCNLPEILPCSMCQIHAGSFVNKTPGRNSLDCLSFHDLLVDLHNSVNERLDKPQYSRIPSNPRCDEKWRCDFWLFTVTQVASPLKCVVQDHLFAGALPFLVPDHDLATRISNYLAMNSHAERDITFLEGIRRLLKEWT